MAPGSQQDMSAFAGLEGKASEAGRVLGSSRFWGAAGSAWPQMPLRDRDAGKDEGAENGSPEKG